VRLTTYTNYRLIYRNYSASASVASNCVHRRNEIMEKRLKRVNPFCEGL
jgi:hypothetical protein